MTLRAPPSELVRAIDDSLAASRDVIEIRAKESERLISAPERTAERASASEALDTLRFAVTVSAETVMTPESASWIFSSRR